MNSRIPIRPLPFLCLLLLSNWLAVVDAMAAIPNFQESYHLARGDYWCENHLTVADCDRDGRVDIVLMTTGLKSPNGPPWSYNSKAILLHNEGDGTFSDSVVARYEGFTRQWQSRLYGGGTIPLKLW